MVTLLYVLAGLIVGTTVRFALEGLRKRSGDPGKGEVAPLPPNALEDLSRRLQTLQEVVTLNAAELGKWESRVLKLEERDLQTRLLVMDSAEKLAARLEDRVRKRGVARTQADEDEESSAQILARMRAASGLPIAPMYDGPQSVPDSRDPAQLRVG